VRLEMSMNNSALESVIKRLLIYQFDEIGFAFRALTSAEKSIVGDQETLNEIYNWVRS